MVGDRAGMVMIICGGKAAKEISEQSYNQKQIASFDVLKWPKSFSEDF